MEAVQRVLHEMTRICLIGIAPVFSWGSPLEEVYTTCRSRPIIDFKERRELQ